MQIRYKQRIKPSQSKRVYLLDLDNTLHHASTHILPEINRQMTRYMMEHLQLSKEQAGQLRTQYWKRYGATLTGLIRHHGIDPHHFLENTHQFSKPLKRWTSRHGSIPCCLSRLPGLRILLTNAPQAYAIELCKVLGLYRHLHAIVSVEDMHVHGVWRPKPSNWLWAGLRKQFPHRSLTLLDDTFGHLRHAARYGIQGVWVTFPEVGRFAPQSLRANVRQRIRRFQEIKRV